MRKSRNNPKLWVSSGSKQEFGQIVNTRHHHLHEPGLLKHNSGTPLFPSYLTSSLIPKNDIVPVMPFTSATGKATLISISETAFSDIDEKGPNSELQSKNEKDSSVSSGETSPTVTETESEVPWNNDIIEGAEKSLYRVTMTHDFKQTFDVDPRGLFNTNNMCFYNSVLQVLVHCEQFYSLVNDIVLHSPLYGSKNPVLSGMAHFFYEYAHTGNTKRAMSSDDFYNVICKQPKFHVERGRQEDAQEFLSDLLDVVEDSFKHSEPTKEDIKDDLRARKREIDANKNVDDGWLEVGQNNKAVDTQHVGHQDLDNPIGELFSGRFRSVLVKKGGKPSITTEPFQQVPVDISSPEVDTLQKAFDEMFKAEELNLDNVQATKALEVERMPPILIVNLKRFTFIRKGDSFDYGKITKPVLINDTLTFSQIGDKTVKYSPFGVVYHHGMDISRGHYTADVKIKNQWFSIDDEQVVPVDNDQVVGHDTNRGSRSAYMVFYTRTL